MKVLSAWSSRAARWIIAACLLSALAPDSDAQSVFRVYPYLQIGEPGSMSITWFTVDSVASQVVLQHPDGTSETQNPDPELAPALVYSEWEAVEHPVDIPPAPFRHRVTFRDLVPGNRYIYTVNAADSSVTASFRSNPAPGQPVRLAVYGDPETEPESVGKHTLWTPGDTLPDRVYLLDQHDGYTKNLQVMAERRPDLILIAGDLVRIGNEQRDWDAFWKYNTHPDSSRTIAGRFPILPVLGNHEYIAPHVDPDDKFGFPQSEDAVARYSTYFSHPPNNASVPEREGRYYRIDYGDGLFSVIALDVNNNTPQGSSSDTNILLTSIDDGEEGLAPSFAPGTEQFDWLMAQLAETQVSSRFTFVLLHYVPYSSGIHGRPAGSGPTEDDLSGNPVRALVPFFIEYGVDALFAGHGETLERSVVTGMEQIPGGSREHTLHVWDIGIGGDELRAPHPDADNPNSVFMPIRDVPETWENGIMLDGGLHYGHLEVNFEPSDSGSWRVRIDPIYAFPMFSAPTSFSRIERRIYDDLIVLEADPSTGTANADGFGVDRFSADFDIYPQPATDRLFVRQQVALETAATVQVIDMLGRRIDTPIRQEQKGWIVETSSLPEGLYGIEISRKGNLQRAVFVVRR